MDEKSPLLLSSAGNEGDGRPPPYEEPAALAPFRTNDPPPYGTDPGTAPISTTGQMQFVQCRVCQNIIHVAPNSQSRVVKCTSCNEATPIAPPPDGKKYVRCPCNCLLTCSATASRVVCPRPNCKRTIGVGTIAVRPISTDRVRVICGKCHKVILWPSNAAVARCPHCRNRSYLYNSWMRYRAYTCLIVGLMMLGLSIILFGVTFTWAESHGGIFVLWIGGFVVGIGLLIRSGFYFVMSQSHMEQ